MGLKRGPFNHAKSQTLQVRDYATKCEILCKSLVGDFCPCRILTCQVENLHSMQFLLLVQEFVAHIFNVEDPPTCQVKYDNLHKTSKTSRPEGKLAPDINVALTWNNWVKFYNKILGGFIFLTIF